MENEWINPDDIGSAGELRDLLVGLGFANTEVKTHPDRSVPTRFFCLIDRVMVRVMPGHTWMVEYWVEDAHHPWSWLCSCRHTGPWTHHQLIQAIQVAQGQAAAAAVARTAQSHHNA